MKALSIALLGLSCLLPLHALAEAPVVDDSENVAMLEEQQAANEPSVAKYDDYNEGQEIALAQDDGADHDLNNDLPTQVKTMQQEIQELRGQLEVQSHSLQVLQQQYLAFYKDLDTRLQQKGVNPSAELPAATNLAPDTAVKLEPKLTSLPIVHTNNPADEQISYLAAYDLVKNRRFDDALAAMQSFVGKYPKGGYTANAEYWLGELYMVKKNYPEAIKHFEIVLKNFSNSSKTAACSLKIGYALASSGKKEEAKLRLQQVIKNYPDTPTAQLAATKLMAIRAS